MLYVTPKHLRMKQTELKCLEKEAHVWLSSSCDICDHARIEKDFLLLAPDEQEHYRRFYFAKDRAQYLVAHVLVREVLSKYVDRPPAEWRFSTNLYGRPEIEPDHNAPRLRFNLTHTDGLCACVVTQTLDCGIDAEDITRRHNLQIISDRIFAPPEREVIGDCCNVESRELFFRYWTLREAYCKARGLGLSGSMTDFYFDAVESGHPRLKYITGSSECSQWQFALLQPTISHMVAVAIHRPHITDLRIVVRNLQN